MNRKVFIGDFEVANPIASSVILIFFFIVFLGIITGLLPAVIIQGLFFLFGQHPPFVVTWAFALFLVIVSIRTKTRKD